MNINDVLQQTGCYLNFYQTMTFIFAIANIIIIGYLIYLYHTDTCYCQEKNCKHCKTEPNDNNFFT